VCYFPDQLIETRVSLEKIRPIEHKLKYQIDKLARGTANGEDLDPLKHRANPDDLMGVNFYADNKF